MGRMDRLEPRPVLVIHTLRCSACNPKRAIVNPHLQVQQSFYNRYYAALSWVR